MANKPIVSKPIASKRMLSKQANLPSQLGFTIIELVLVIVVMGILAVTVAPKMFDSDGFEEYTYQAQLIATLQSVQLRAMQQTEGYTDSVDYGNGCHTVVVSAKNVALSADCKLNAEQLNVPGVEIDNSHDVSFSPAFTFTFDAMGRPVSCTTACEILINGDANLTVKIESEGFIHAL